MKEIVDLTRELKTLWNMKVPVIPIVIGAFGTATKGLLKGLVDLEIRGWVETIQTTTLLRRARILRRFLETWEDFCLSNFSCNIMAEGFRFIHPAFAFS